MGKSWRQLSALGVGVAMISFGTPVLSGRAAASPTGVDGDVSALVGGLQSYGQFSHALATQGALGQPLPLVSLAPGGAQGLDFAGVGEDGLFDAALYKTLNDKVNSLSGQVHLADVASSGGTTYPLDLTGGSSDRQGTLTLTSSAPSSGLEKVSVALDVTRTVKDQGLAVAGSVGSQPVSLTSTNGVQVVLRSHLTMDAFLQDTGGGAYAFYLGHGTTTPALTVDAEATLPSPGGVDAAIGILGVSLGSGTAFDSQEHLAVSYDDPNSDGQLAFKNVDGSAGELAQPGAATGLVHVGYASPAGSVTDTGADQGTTTPATFAVTPKPLQSGSPALPGTNLTVSWPDVSTGAPTIGDSDTNLTALDDFLNLGPKDLVQGLAHLATTVSAVERAQWGSSSSPQGNVDLPYMKGTLADAVDASAALSGFVTQFTYNPANPNLCPPGVTPAPDSCAKANDPALRGLPTFASVQDLVNDLDNFAPGASPTYDLPGQATITVGAMDFNDSTSGPDKLLLPLTIQTKAPATALALDVQPTLASGGGGSSTTVTYGPTSLTDTALGATGFNSGLAGQEVEVTTPSGVVTGIVDNVSGDTLNLKKQTEISSGSQYWVVPPANPGDQPTGGSQPSDNTDPYRIVGPDPQSGTLQLGDALAASSGIAKANADASKATVSPSYTLGLGLVLDLAPAVTGSSCNTSTAATEFPAYTELPTACPFQHTNPDGSTTTISRLPTNPDRIQLRTGPVSGLSDLLTADFPITSPAPDDFAAQVGYLGVHLSGQLDLSAPGGGSHMRTIDLKPQTAGDGSSDVTLDAIVRKLATDSTASTSSLLSESQAGSLSGWLAVDVPDSSTSSGPSFFGQSATCAAHSSTALPCFSVAWPDLSSGSPAVTADSALGVLKSFAFDAATPTALVAPLVKSLQVADGSLGALGGASATLRTQVPVVGQSLGSLLAAEDNGGGPSVSYGSNTLTDAARPFSSQDGQLAGHTMTVGTQVMTISPATPPQAASGGGTLFTFTAAFPTVPAAGTPYTLSSPIKDALTALAAQPPTNLQGFTEALAKVLGYGSKVTIGVDTNVTPAALVVNLDWARVAHTPTAAALTFTPNSSGASSPQDLVETPTASPIVTTTKGHDTLGIEVPLADGTGPAGPDQLKVTDASTVGGDLAISGKGSGTPTANIGPLAVNLSDGSSDQLDVAGAYTVKIGGASDTNTQSMSAFLGQPPALSSGGADCKAGTGDALCAYLPVYQGSTNLGPVKVHIPSGASDLLAVSGNIDAGPSALGDAINAANINFGGFLGGIDNYFSMAEQGLSDASFGGKLPLIGSDLQEGSDFVGKLKANFDSAVKTFTSAVPTTAGGIRNQLQSDLQSNLPAGPPAPTATVKVSCAAPLQPVDMNSSTSKATTDGKSTQKYQYEALAYKTVNGSEEATKPGASVTLTNDTTLDTTANYNDLYWSQNPDADGYILLRSVDNGATWHQLKDLAGSGSTHYKDDGTDAPAGANYSVPTSEPTITYDGNCPDSTSIQYVSKVAATVTASGSVSSTMPFNIGIPGLTLSSDDAANAPTASAHWSLNLSFGIDKQTGFFITADGTTKVLSVDAEVQSAKAFSAQLGFLKLDITDNNSTLKCGSDTNLRSNACLQASIVLKSPSGNGEITADQLANPGDLGGAIKAEVNDPAGGGGVNINWAFQASATSMLPGIGGNFVVKWNPSFSSDNGAQAGDLDIAFKSVAVDGGVFLAKILGPIVSQIKAVAGPIQPVVDQLTAPIPVLSDLSHLAGGGDVTLLSIAEAFNTLAGGPNLDLVHRLVSLTSLFGKLAGFTKNCSPGSCMITLGDFDISGSGSSGPQQLLDNPATPDSTLKPGSNIGSLPSSAPDMGSNLSTDAGSSGSNLFPSGSDSSVSLNDNCAPVPNSDSSQTESAGLTFPVVAHPFDLFRLLLGQDISLACFDSGELKIGFSYSQAFGPVYAPPPVLITISGSASASLHLVGGFDTYGLRTAAQDIAAGKATPGTALTFLDSLFFTTTDANGNPIPVVTLTGTLAAGAEVSAVIISVGVQGGITLTVNFTWRDPDNDGKFRFDEFLATALSNPLCLFNVNGSLSVFLELDITLGVSPFSTSFSITLVNIKLLDFSIQPDCTPPPPQLGGYDPGSKTLLLYMGTLGTGDLRGDPAWDNGGKADESFKVTQYHASDGSVTGVAVDGMGVHDYYPNDSQPISTVYMDAAGGNGTGPYTGNETLTLQGGLDPNSAPSTTTADQNVGKGQGSVQYPFTAAAVVYGGSGNDTIKTGQGPSFVDGGQGDDHITTGDVSNAAGRAVVAGGPGNDGIRVGNADDQVAGDSALSSPGQADLAASGMQAPGQAPTTSKGGVNGIPDWTKTPTFPSDSSLSTPNSAAPPAADGNDVIAAGLGADHLWGGGGDDTISVAPDNPAAGLKSQGAVIVGGDGADHITGGDAADHIYTGESLNPTNSDGTETNPDASGPADSCTSGDGAPACVSGLPVNVVDTGGGVDTTANPPAVVGGGSDFVYGSQGIDIVSGHSAPAETDHLYGGGGDDVLTGGYGTDRIYGGPGNDYITAEPSHVSDVQGEDNATGTDFGPLRTVSHDALPAGVTSSVKYLVGGGGNDHIYGGDGGATIFGDSDTEASCPSTGTPPAAGTPPSEAGQSADGNDYVIGGTGQDVVQAGGGDDYVSSSSGNDFLCGGAGNDVLLGGSSANQTDTVYGGSGNDVVQGGAGGDYLFGNAGNDTLYGEAGNDTLEGNDGTDTLYGGPGDDVLIGGTAAAAQPDEGDTLYGGSGRDLMIGDNGAQVDSTGAPDMSRPGFNPADVNGNNDPLVQVYDLQADASHNSVYGGKDALYGGDDSDYLFGGLGGDFLDGGAGNDHIEGGPGSDTAYGGPGTDDILGGTSPLAVDGGSVDTVPDGSANGADLTPADLPTQPGTTGNVIYGDYPTTPEGASDPSSYADTIVGGNGSITETGVADGNDGAPVRAVQQLALLTVGGDDQITGGPGDDQIFGGLGDDHIHAGSGDNYAEGGPGSDTIYGGAGSNDIIGGTSPLTLPTSGADALTTAAVPDGVDTVYADGYDTTPPAGYAADGGNVVIGDNGCISREFDNPGALDANGCPTGPSASPSAWHYSGADPHAVDSLHPYGVVQRVIRQLDAYDCPNGSCSSPDVQGAGDNIWGGTGDDVLLGEVGNDQIFGGPPGTNGVNGTAGSWAGDDHMEGGLGSDVMAGGSGDDDMFGGTAPDYLPAGRTTSMVSDGTVGSATLAPAAPGNPLLAFPGSGVIGNTIDGGGGNDVMVGGNGVITHTLGGSGQWATNQNDGAFIRSVVQLDLANGGPAGIGGDDTMRGGPGDDKMFGGIGNDSLDGGDGADYLEGGSGRDLLQGGAGDDDIIGGSSPTALPPPPAGQTSDQVAAAMPDGTPDAAHPGQTLGNVACGYYCGQSLAAGSDDDVLVGNNGRVDRCPATVSNGVGTPQGSDTCKWGRTPYGVEKDSSSPGTAQDGGLTTSSLGSPRTRYVTLLGQSPSETGHNGNDYLEGNSGNDVLYGEDGNDAVHGDTPLAGSPSLYECLPTSDPTAGQDVILGGYGNDTLCGDGGDDGILGNRGLVKVVPFSNSSPAGPVTIGTTSGGPYGTLTFPGSGNTIYQVDLSQEYVDGVLTAVPNWNNPAASGQGHQHDDIFGGQGNDTIHGSPGDDFLQGDDGMHVAGQAAATGGDDIVFGDGGRDSMEGGPGNDHLFGGPGEDDQDVLRSDAAVAPKTDNSGHCLPILYPTLNVDPTAMLTTNGCPTTTGFGAQVQSYASRFPLAAGTYDSDPGAQDNGGTASHTTTFGDVIYGGFDRDIMQSQGTPPGFGDRLIDSTGAYNLEYLCPAAYGGWQIIRSLSPAMLTFLQKITQGDGAVNTTDPNSSGGTEAAIVYPNLNVPDNGGSAYPNTAGHFTC